MSDVSQMTDEDNEAPDSILNADPHIKFMELFIYQIESDDLREQMEAALRRFKSLWRGQHE